MGSATISFDSTKLGKTIHPLEADIQKTCWAWLVHVRPTSTGMREVRGTSDSDVNVLARSLQDFTYMVPNGTQLAGSRNRRAIYMASLKAQGFRVGVSDFVIAYPKWGSIQGQCLYAGAYIELKRDVGAYSGPKALRTALRPEQRDWLNLMKSVGYWVGVAYGFEDFQRHVKNYLAGKSPRALDLFDWLEDTESAQ